jgi:AcrR family transcriptional regulator
MARTRASDFEEKQQSLLASAAAVLAEQGMDKASMAQIATQAGVSKALLYHYYPGKDALIFGIIEGHLSALDEKTAAADDPNLPPQDRLRALVWAVLEAYRGADDAHQVQLNAMSALTDEQRAAITAIERRIVKRFSSVLREINPDIDRADRPLLMPVTMSLFGMMNWVYMWFREGGPISRKDYAELATALILGGIAAVR